MSKLKKKHKAKQKEMSASEALFGFMGWLTSRDEVTPNFSSAHDATEAADLVSKFIKANKLTTPTENWTNKLTIPED